MQTINRKQRYSLGLVLGVLACSLGACRPVITVGWGEILILVMILALLVGPLVLRFLRRKAGITKDGSLTADNEKTD